MFQVLIESSPHATQRRARWTVMSALAHATLLTAAVVATTRSAQTLSMAPVRAESLTYVRVIETTPAVPMGHSGFESRVWTHPDLPKIPMPDLPGLDVFTAGEKLASKDDWPTERGLSAMSGAAGVPAGGVYPERLVDRPVIPLADNARPEYPRALRASAVEGEVRARFVVDTIGRVEPSSISIMQATHALFAESVRVWLLRTRYLPAEAAGRPVRQVVEQRIGFTLER
jgi:TonB family protein